METKKNPEYDLERKSSLFFAIGLAVALLIVTLAFEWKSQYAQLDLSAPDAKWDEPYVVQITAFPKPEPPKPKTVNKVKPNNQPPVFVESEEVQEIIAKLENTKEVIPFYDFPIEEPAPEVVEIVEDIVENMPTFPGGMSEFYKYVSENLEYPSKARSMGVSGRVYIQFIIDTDGKLIEVKSIKGIGMGCDEEAVRVLSNSPKWYPGKQRGREVKVRMVLPVQFALQ